MITRVLRFHLAHSTWALHRLLDAAATLPASKLEEDLGIGPGPLRENLAHTIEAMFFYADNFAGRVYEDRPHFSGGAGTVEGLRGLLDEAHAALSGAILAAAERGLDDRTFWQNAPGKSLPTEVAIAQTFDHAVLHRTQCINMLKRLGVRPVPDLDPMSFEGTGARW